MIQRSCVSQNEKRKVPLELSFVHENILSDQKLSQNVENVMQTILSDKFKGLIKEHGDESLIAQEYAKVEKNYNLTKEKEFKIVFAGLYSSGKSTILNSLIRHNVLPTSDKTCTAKTS